MSEFWRRNWYYVVTSVAILATIIAVIVVEVLRHKSTFKVSVKETGDGEGKGPQHLSVVEEETES